MTAPDPLRLVNITEMAQRRRLRVVDHKDIIVGVKLPCVFQIIDFVGFLGCFLHEQGVLTALKGVVQ
ncbi:hypothetical protein ES703_27205 [subsurface metagenome]